MFDEFKAKHGGLGPAQLALDAVTGGELSNRIQRQAVGAQMDDTLAAIKADDTLLPDFKDHAGELLAHGIYDVPQALKNIGAVRAEAQTQRTIGGAFAPVVAGAQKLYDAATAPEDQSVLSTLLGNAEAAHKLAADPATRQQGMQLFGQVAQDVANFTTQAKANKITADTQAAQAERDLDKTQLAAYQNSRENWQKESTPFRQIASAWPGFQTIAALKNPTPQSDQQLMRLSASILNPGVAMRPGEDPGEQYYDALGEVGKAVKFALTNGTLLTPEERQTVVYSVAQRVAQENVAQSGRNTAALNEGRAENLPSKYLDQLTAPAIDLGAFGDASPGGPQTTTTTGGGGHNPPAQTQGPQSKAAQVGLAAGGAVIDALAGVGEAAGMPVGDAIRKAAGQPQSADTYKDTSGNIYRKVDRGHGRFEWQLYKAAPAAAPQRDTDEIQVTSASGGF